MTSCADLINQTEQHLLAGDRETMNVLTSSVVAGDTSMTFTYQPDGIDSGSYIALDLEVIYVLSIAGNTATVLREMLGSTAASHAAGTLVYVNPKFSKWSMFNAINSEIVDLSGPPNGLFQVKDFTATTFPVQRTYAVPAQNTDLIKILEVRWIAPGPELRWDRVPRWGYDVLRNMPEAGTGSFPSGMALRVEETMYPGRPLNVVYAAPFTPLTALSDDVATVTGLPTSSFDIPPLGAAARLMGVREAKRAFTESEVDTRRAAEVPVGANAKAAQTLLALLNERIKTEFIRLKQQWPDRM